MDSRLLDQLNAAVIVADIHGVVSDWNRHAERVYGWTRDEAVGREMRTLMVPPDRLEEAAEIGTQIRSGESWQGEFEMQHKDGRRLTVFASGSPVLDEEGRVAGTVGVHVDITELKVDERNATEALRESEERNSAVVASALDCIITMDRDGRIVEFNPATERTFGYRRDDVLGKLMADLLIPPDLRDRHRAALARYLETGQPTILGKRIELRGMRSDGTEFPVELTISETRTSGFPVFIGYVRDLTERRRLEDERTATLQLERAAREQAQGAERRVAFLLRASTALGSTLDYHSTLDQLARLVVETMADVCVIDVRDEDTIRRVAAVHRDPAQQHVADRILRFSPVLESDHPSARVIRSGRPEVVSSMSAEMMEEFEQSSEYSEALRQLSPRSYMSVPLAIRGRVLGAIFVLSTDPEHTYQQADVDLLSDLAVRAAAALENASLHARTEEAVALTEESLALLDTLLATAPVGLAFVDSNLRYVRINDALAAMNASSAADHLGRSMREMLSSLADLVEPLLRQVLETGEPVLDVDITGELPGRTGVVGHWLGSYYPVRGSGGAIIGVGIVIVDITEQKHIEDELRTVRRELTDQLEDMTKLLQLSGRLSSSLELQPVLDEVLRAVISLQGADTGILRLYDPETDELYSAATVELPEAYIDEIRRVPARAGVWGKAFAERRPFFVEDVDEDPIFEPYREAARIGRYRSVYTSPLITRRGDVLGTIATHFRAPWRPSIREARLIELYALEAADVIDNAQLYRESREAGERLEFLAEASRILSSSLDYNSTLAHVARLVVPRVADWCSIDMREEDGSIRQVTVAHADPDKVKWAHELQRKYPPDPSAPTGSPNVIRTGRSELYPEIPQEMIDAAVGDDQELRHIIDEIGFSSFMVVPLTSRARTLGAITFVAAESGRHYGPADLSLAEDLARRAAQAVDNARLYSEQRHIARTLQQTLLPPQLPVIPGIEVAARYQAGREGTEVGGDFYDLFETAGGGWGIVMGDVCGKGPEAAAVTGLARYTIRAAAMSDQSPSSILGTLNDAIRQQRDDLRFATVAYARMMKRNAHVEFNVSCGGHPLPLVVRVDGSVESVGSPGTLLGIFEDAELVDDGAVLGPGDSVVLYTDGVTQSRGGASLEAEDLRALVAGCGDATADEIADQIVASAASEEAEAPRDDVAVLVLRVQG